MHFPYIRYIRSSVYVVMLFWYDQWIIYIIHIHIIIIGYRLYFMYIYILISCLWLYILYCKIFSHSSYNIIHTRIGHSLFSGLLSSYRLLLLFKLSYSCLTSFLLTNGAIFFITHTAVFPAH